MKREAATSKIEVRVTSTEKNKIKELAQVHGLTVSEYMRQAALTQEVRGAAEVQTVLKLAQVNADLARLGNLFKLALENMDDIEMKRLVKQIRKTQLVVKEAALKI